MEEKQIIKEEQLAPVRKFLMKFASSLYAEQEILTVLHGAKSDAQCFWLTVCLADGMGKKEFERLANANISEIQNIRREHLKQKFIPFNQLYQTVSQLEKQVDRELRESQDVRGVLQNQLDVSLKKQEEMQKQLLEAKEEQIASLKMETIELKRIQESMKKELSQKEEMLKELEKGLPGKIAMKKENSYVTKKELSEKKSSSWFHQFFGKEKTVNASAFIKEFLENDNYKDDQKEYFLECLEAGISLEEMKKFASPHLSVAMMKRVRKYYEKERRNHDSY